MDVPPIRTERLELVSMSPGFVDALLRGRREAAIGELGIELPPSWPANHTSFLQLRLRQMQRDPAAQRWLARAITLAGDERRPFVGFAGFHGPPGTNALRRPDAVELGYEIEPEFRRRGYATETVHGLIRWAHEEHGVRAFVASIAPTNEPSLALVRKLGFTHVGEHEDEEDGLEHEFLLTVESPARSSAERRAR